MKKSLKRISALITFGTLLSKFGGMVRQIVIAGVFGVGTAYDAYNYAYILPGFFLILIGGINGPLHNAIVTVLSKRDREESLSIICSINTSITILFFIFSLLLFFFAEKIIHILGPGLNQATTEIAISQLKIMSPIILVSGLIGIGFGALNSSGEFFITSISPIVSSLVLIVGVLYFGILEKYQFNSLGAEIGGSIIAISTLIGAILQLALQLPSLKTQGLLQFKIFFDWSNKGVKEVWRIIIPATLSSGMLQINVFSDLFFASNIVGAAASLSYANFLVQAPLGLVSNALLLPLLPILSKLANNNDKINLVRRIRQGFIFSTASMICLGAIFISQGEIITSLVFGRGVFNNDAIIIVSGLLVFYGIGMPAYLLRDLLVRVFYTLGNSNFTFKVSFLGIIINFILDWIFIGGPTPWGNQIPINLGTKGLVLATVGVNIFTCIILLLKLKAEINFIYLKSWCNDFLKLTICGCISVIIASSFRIFNVDNILFQSLNLLIGVTLSIFSFSICSSLLGIKEVRDIISIFKSKIKLS